MQYVERYIRTLIKEIVSFECRLSSIYLSFPVTFRIGYELKKLYYIIYNLLLN